MFINNILKKGGNLFTPFFNPYKIINGYYRNAIYAT